MIVLDGATSQPNRSDFGSPAIGPADGSPAATRTMPCNCSRTVGASTLGVERGEPDFVEIDQGLEKVSLAAEERSTPALIRSPRSTRGTIRTIA